VEEREKREEEKDYRKSSSVPWRPTRTGPPYRGGHDASDPFVEGYNGY